MKMLRLIWGLLLILLSSFSYAQGGNGQGNLAGTLYASNFGYWSVPQGNSGMFAWSDSSICMVTSGGITFPAFKAGTPFRIVDANPAMSETVTPSAVRMNGAGCQVTVSPANPHTSFYMTTATAGLQEAINYANGLPYMVYVTPDFTRLQGTTGTITSALGNAAVSILDVRDSCPVAYTWGSSYTGVNLCSGGAGGTVQFEHNDSVLGGQFAASPQIFDLNDTTPAADPGYMNGIFKTDTATGRVSVEVLPLENQIVSPAGQHLRLWPTVVGATCTHGSTCGASGGPAGANSGAAISGGAHNTIDGIGGGLSFGGYALPAGFTGTITSVYAVTNAITIGELDPVSVGCGYTGGSAVLYSGPSNGQFSAQLTGLTGPNISTVACTGTVIGSVATSVPASAGTGPMELDVYYTGSAFPQNDNAVQAQYPLYLFNNGVNTVLAINPTAPFPGLYQIPYTVGTLPSSSTWPVLPVLGAVYNVVDLATSGQCATGGGSVQGECQWNGTAYVSVGGGGGGGITGSGTTGFFMCWVGTTAAGNCPVDYNATNAGKVTSTKDIVIADGSGVGGGFDATEGTTVSGTSGLDSVWASSSAHWLLFNPNNTGALYFAGIATPGTGGNCVEFASGGKTLADAGAPCGSGGGSTAFSALTSGLNAGAAMQVGSGASLTPTGTGTIIPSQGVWQHEGTIISPTQGEEYNATESSLIYEGSPQLLSGTGSESIFKMWWTCGYNITGLCYAESVDAETWMRAASPVITRSNPGPAHGRLFHYGSTYYYYAADPANGTNQVNRWESSNGYTGWTLTHSNVLSLSGSGWDSGTFGNIRVVPSSGTWLMMYEAAGGGTAFQMGVASSTDQGVTWTKFGGNPVISENSGANEAGGPDIHLINNIWYVWGHCTLLPLTGNTPTDICRWHSPTFLSNSWVQDLGGNAAYSRATPDEGAANTIGQLGDPSLIQVGNRIYMSHEGVLAQNGTTPDAFHLKLATAPYTFEQLVQTQEGNATNYHSAGAFNSLNLSTCIYYDNNFNRVPCANNTGQFLVGTLDFQGGGISPSFGQNFYYDGSNSRYITAGAASLFLTNLSAGQSLFAVYPNGTANAVLGTPVIAWSATTNGLALPYITTSPSTSPLCPNGTGGALTTVGCATGSGTTTIASGTSALGTSSVSTASCATVVTTAASGVASTDSITWNTNGSIKAVTGYTPATTGGLTINAYPTSGDVNFDVCNWTSGSITPGAVTINWRVVR